jgi:DhnA family fructose-bisphosphate aldolase class Ia
LESESEQYKRTLGDYSFRVEDFFPRKLFDLITETRVHNPQAIVETANARRRREKLTRDGKLTILACDHPARMVTSIGEKAIAIADRYEFLGRITRILMSPEFDGVMGTPDIIEELLIVDHLIKEKGGPSLLSEKVILGCMNRGGLSGASFELDDRYTAFTAESIQNMRLDGAKLMFRLDLENPDAGKTIYYTSQAINECNRLGVPVFLEALPVEKQDGKYKTKKSTEEIVKVIGVATGLGDSSRNLWLKIPYCENYQQVANATTCPILILGGEALGDPTYIFKDLVDGAGAGKNVRGALIGRNVHFPGKDDPQAVALAVSGIFHHGYGIKEAIEAAFRHRGKDADSLQRLFEEDWSS